jgi:hypothetical protein
MAKYKLQSTGVLREDGAYIPECMENSDWREYQDWIAIEGNTPDPRFSPEEVQANALASIRAQRNMKLLESDFTQLPDAPLTVEQKAAWCAYREALRDFPETCDPVTPVWPVEPV